MTELYQDEDGFVWIGTTNGLSRYDGYRLQTFQTDYRHPGRLTHNHITCIAEDSAYLWVGTRKGLNLVDKRTYRITTPGEAPLQTAYIRSLCSDGKSRIWIALNDRLLESRFPYNEYTSIKLPTLSFMKKEKNAYGYARRMGFSSIRTVHKNYATCRLWDKPTLLSRFSKTGTGGTGSPHGEKDCGNS